MINNEENTNPGLEWLGGDIDDILTHLNRTSLFAFVCGSNIWKINGRAARSGGATIARASAQYSGKADKRRAARLSKRNHGSRPAHHRHHAASGGAQGRMADASTRDAGPTDASTPADAYVAFARLAARRIQAGKG